MSIRPVKRFIESKLTIEGVGVKLRRAFAASRATPGHNAARGILRDFKRKRIARIR
jgi:hypothetical protein